MKLAVMQPTYLPWIGYLDLADQVDEFVFLDDATFAHRSWQQRNRIVSGGNLQWITVPVQTKGMRGQSIDQVAIDRLDFGEKHLRTMAHAYAKSPCFGDFAEGLQQVYSAEEPWTRLVDVNLALLEWLFDQFDMQVSTHRSSELKASGRRGERLAAICLELGATQYVSAPGAETYLVEDAGVFLEQGIDVRIQSFAHPVYPQLCDDFVSHASAVDLLFNHGKESMDWIRSGRGPATRLEEVP